MPEGILSWMRLMRWLGGTGMTRLDESSTRAVSRTSLLQLADADCVADKNDDADHRYMLFSATFPKEARKLAKKYLDDDHIRIRVGRQGSTLSNIVQRASLPFT